MASRPSHVNVSAELTGSLISEGVESWCTANRWLLSRSNCLSRLVFNIVSFHCSLEYEHCESIKQLNYLAVSVAVQRVYVRPPGPVEIVNGYMSRSGYEAADLEISTCRRKNNLLFIS